MTPKISVCCVTYNHVHFIEEALEGFVTQKTNFPFEVIIGDDCSTDGTTEVIRAYAQKYPEIIKPIFHNNNVGSYQNVIDVANKCSGEYVAVCDGDDYWIDENKLQKQVDFMDTHTELAMCFHPVIIKYEDSSQKDTIFPKPRHRFYKNTLDINDLLKYNFIQTNSVVYRWVFNNNSLENVLPKSILPVDYYLHLSHASKGKIGFLPDVMAVYRRHSNGIWHGVNSSDKWFLHYGMEHLRFYDAIEKDFGAKKIKEKTEMVRNIALASLRNGNKIVLNELQDAYQPILQLAFTEKKSILTNIKYIFNKIRKRFMGFIPAVFV